MPKKKLTDRLKERIKRDYHRLRQADFEGDALRYLRQVRGGHKGRRVQARLRKEKEAKVAKQIPKAAEGKKGRSIKIGDHAYAPGSQVYELIKLSALNVGMTMPKFMKEHQGDLEKLIKNYLVFARKEIDDVRRLIKALPRSSKIFSPVKHGGISAKYASFILHMVKKSIVATGLTYDVVFIEYGFDLEANLHLSCPRPGEYKNLEGGGFLEFIDDQYPNITYIGNDTNNQS